MKDWLKKIKLNESNISLLLGAVVVVLIGYLLFNYFGSINQVSRETTSSSSTESTAQSTLPKLDELPKDYIVQKGDTLWNISERVYGNGNRWSEILAANENLKENPDNLMEGITISLPLPKVEAVSTPVAIVITPTVAPTATVPTPTVEPEPEGIGGRSEYTVVAGDSLWKIAQKTYGSGYRWVDIYEANKDQIQNPNIILTGTRITMPTTTDGSYTVVKGDNLWNIAVNYCENGFAWTKIAEVNAIPNPRIIEPGLVLKIECK